MFILFAFPIADLREFVLQDTHKLQKPTIPAEAGKHFIRYTGEVSIRMRGGSQVFGGEDLFCIAKRACRLPADPSWTKIQTKYHQLNAKCVLRRFFQTGPATSRFEIGFRLTLRKSDKQKGIPLQSVIDQVGNIPVRVGTASSTAISLVNVGDELASHFRKASTSLNHKTPCKGKTWWCAGGEPIVVVELDDNDGVVLPKYNTTVEAIDDSNVKLRYARINAKSISSPLGCWILHVAKYVDVRPARQLRMHLVRIHGEVQCLKRVVQLSQTEMKTDPVSSRTDKLYRYLDTLVDLLGKTKRHGTQQSNLLQMAYESQQSAKPGELTTIMCATKDLMSKIEDQRQSHKKYRTTQWERVLVAATALFIISLVSFLVVRNERIADPNFIVMIRTLISLAVAVLGAVIPGFLNISWHGSGFAIRAGGALALFALTFLVTPTVL